MPAASPDSADADRTNGIDRPDLLLIAVLFGLAGAGLIGLGFAGFSPLDIWSSEAAIGALAGGLIVLLPTSLGVLYAVEETRRSLEDTREEVTRALSTVRSETVSPEEVQELLSRHQHLSSSQQEQARSHTFQEQAQDRMEASHERQEAKLLDLEDRLEALVTQEEMGAWMDQQDERIRELRDRQEILLYRVIEDDQVWEHLAREDRPRTPSNQIAPAGTYRMDEVPSVSGSQARLLGEHGLATTDTFLHADMGDVHEATSLPLNRLRAWRDMAEMMVMVDGVDPELAQRLAEAGIEDIAALARADPDELDDALQTTVAAQDTDGTERSLRTVIAEARRFTIASRQRATS